MLGHAQTNVQLLNQLRALGYSVEDLQRVAAAYDHACELFCGLFRGSGRPFLSHLVGSTSMLAALRAPAPTLIAALFHAAYTNGDFGSGVTLAEKRKEISDTIGAEAEHLVFLYSRFPWNPAAIADYDRRLRHSQGDLSPSERQVLLLRLANEADDHSDLTALYYASVSEANEFSQNVEALVNIARALQQPVLGEEIERLRAEIAAADVEAALRSRSENSYVLTPRSFVRRDRRAWRGRAAGVLDRIVQRLMMSAKES